MYDNDERTEDLSTKQTQQESFPDQKNDHLIRSAVREVWNTVRTLPSLPWSELSGTGWAMAGGMAVFMAVIFIAANWSTFFGH